jgi:hypothetical protein
MSATTTEMNVLKESRPRVIPAKGMIANSQGNPCNPSDADGAWEPLSYARAHRLGTVTHQNACVAARSLN